MDALYKIEILTGPFWDGVYYWDPLPPKGHFKDPQLHHPNSSIFYEINLSDFFYGDPPKFDDFFLDFSTFFQKLHFSLFFNYWAKPKLFYKDPPLYQNLTMYGI